MLFNAHIAASRSRIGASRTALVDSPIGKQSPDNVLPFPASNRPQAASTYAHVEHKPRVSSQVESESRKGTCTRSEAAEAPRIAPGAEWVGNAEGSRGPRVSKARTVPKNSLPGAARSAFDAAFGETWALWQALPGIAHHKRFVDSDRQAFKQTWALLGGDSQALADMQAAIKRYSAWSEGAKAGTYRPAYRWTFCEFIRHKRGSLIQRLASDSWEQTCEPFQKTGGARPDRSVASLLASASRLASEGGA